MTNAPKTVGLVHNGFGGWRLWTTDDADDPTVEAVPYILAAEHERLMAERDAEIARLRNDLQAQLAEARDLLKHTLPALDAAHDTYIMALGRNPDDYNSKFRRAAAAIRAMKGARG